MSDNFNAKHPDSVFQAEYPYNQSTVTRSGHEIHVNDTPGNESLKISHTKGSYVEIDSYGRWVQVVADKAYNYYKDGFSETVDGHKDVKVHGAYNLNVDNSTNEVTKGNNYKGVGGDYNIIVGGTQYNHVGANKDETINGISTKSVLSDEHININGNKVTSVGSAKTDIIGGAYSVSAGSGGIDMQTQGNFNIKCDLFSVECSAFTISTPFGILSVDSSGIGLNGSIISVNGSISATINAPIVNINENI
jgi:hypothetical protein